MPALSYSFHLSTKSHSVSTTGKVLQVSRHNLRDYVSSQYNRDLIHILRGSEISILDDVKRVYHEEFDTALEEYNKGKRSDRIIKDYLKHVSDSRGDVACEIIIQVGDREYWENVRQKGWSVEKIRQQMTPIFQSQIEELEKLVPELKIASVVAHYDESSPHMHVVGVPVATGYKKGLSKQVAKTKVFTPERLSILQDRMREAAHADIERNHSVMFWESWDSRWNIDLNGKKPGRNKDIPKTSLDEYYRVKKKTENLKLEAVEAQRDVEGIEKEKTALEDDISRLRAAQSLLKQEIDDAQKIIDSIEKERETLQRERKEIQGLKDSIDEYTEQLSETNAELKDEIHDKRTMLSALEKQEKELKENIDNLSEQVEDKLVIVNEELSPEFVRQMLNDSITANLVQEVVSKTCKQLGDMGYLKVDPMQAFLSINKNSILESMKEHINGFIKDVKTHISKMILKKSKNHRRGR